MVSAPHTNTPKTFQPSVVAFTVEGVSFCTVDRLSLVDEVVTVVTVTSNERTKMIKLVKNPSVNINIMFQEQDYFTVFKMDNILGYFFSCIVNWYVNIICKKA